MKVDALVQSLGAISDTVDKEPLADFARAARAFGASKSLKSLITHIQMGATPSAGSNGALLGSIVGPLDRLVLVANAIGSKAVRDELAEFQSLVRTNARLPLLSIAAAPANKTGGPKKAAELRAELVAQYAQEIAKLRLGSPELTHLFARLAEDKKMRAIEMAALASRVAYETPPSTRRGEALRRIKQRHESYLTSAAKSEALKGSSAT